MLAPRSKENISGLILCGGAGQRMGGADKGLIDFQGRALVDIAVERLRPQVHTVIISANRNTQHYANRGLKIIQDMGFREHQPNFEGPLAGILAGLGAMQTDWLMVVPCDCPHFPTDIVSTLVKSTQQPDSARAQRACGAAYVQGHPVFTLLPKTAKPMLEDYLRSGQRKLNHWFDQIGATAVAVDHALAFQNINTPHDLSNTH
ncbi:molybdenum cofactor guanylyltransferase MobA [beta proteobacterium MWH-UniP1]